MYKHKTGITLRKFEYEDLSILKNLVNRTWYGRHS